MSKIVGGFTVPHIPLMGSIPEAPPAETAQRIWAAFDHVSARMRALKVDTIITIGDDHCINFSPECVPQCLIAIGDVQGPKEDWLRIDRQRLAVNEPLAEHILRSGQDDGLGWAFSKDLTVDHAVMIPHHYCYRHVSGARIIPVYLNATVPPFISNGLAHRVGASIARAVESWPGDARVAVVGTGGLSHWVGMAGMGRTNEAFDRGILKMFEAGDVRGLVALEDAHVIAEGGNGALEIKNWIAALGAMPGARAEVIAYEPVAEWITGVGFAEMRYAQSPGALR